MDKYKFTDQSAESLNHTIRRLQSDTRVSRQLPAPRPGVNYFMARITAVDPDTGELDWTMMAGSPDGLVERDPAIIGSGAFVDEGSTPPAVDDLVRLTTIGSDENGTRYFAEPISAATSGVRFIKLTADWDPVLRPNFVMGLPCDQDGKLLENPTPAPAPGSGGNP